MVADRLQQETGRHIIIAITDHDTMSGISEAKCAGVARGIQVISGQEITAKGRFGLPKHILALGIENPIPSGKSPEWTIEEIKKADGIVVIPHPNLFPVGSLMESEITKLAQEFKFDGIEVKSQGRTRSHRRIRELNSRLGGRLGTELGGNDSHFGFSDMATSFTEIRGKDVFEAIRTGATKARKGVAAHVSVRRQMRQHFRADIGLNIRRLQGKLQ
jgi:hypothetical protein